MSESGPAGFVTATSIRTRRRLSSSMRSAYARVNDGIHHRATEDTERIRDFLGVQCGSVVNLYFVSSPCHDPHLQGAAISGLVRVLWACLLWRERRRRKMCRDRE